MDTKWSIRKFLKRHGLGLRHAGSVALRAFGLADGGSSFQPDRNLEGDRITLIKERGLGNLIEGLKETLGGFFGKERMG